MLISDFELDEDDREPYLQYAIRESTLYFLSDLVCEFFVKNEIKAVEDIEKQGWYFTEYGLDASIQSIIAAIKIIEEKLPLETVAFGNFSIRAEGLLKEIKARVKGIVEKTDLFNLGFQFYGFQTFEIVVVAKSVACRKKRFPTELLR